MKIEFSIAFSRRPKRCYGAPTAFCRYPTWSSCWRLPAISRRFHCVHCDLTALPPHSLRSRGALTCSVVGDITALLWRSYGTFTALLLERRGTAFVLCMLKTNAVLRSSVDFTALPRRSHGVLGDATELLPRPHGASTEFYNF